MRSGEIHADQRRDRTESRATRRHGCIGEIAHMQDLDLEEQEKRARWVSLMERMETARIRKEARLDQQQRRVDLGLGYIVYCCRRSARRSQNDLASRISSSQSTVSKWERGERLPSLSALGLVADATDLELILGLRDPRASTAEDEFVLLATYRGEGPVAELEIFHDRYQNDHIPPRPWRAELEAQAERHRRAFAHLPTAR